MVVLYGCQGADNDAEILALTDSYLTLLLGELSVLAREQPSLIVGDFNSTRSPPRSLAWQKGSRLRSGLTLKLLGVWLGVSSLLLLASALGIPPVVIVGTSWSVALLLPLLSRIVGSNLVDGLCLILLFEPFLTVIGGLVRPLNLSSELPSGLLHGSLP